MKVFAPALVTVSAINATGWDASLVCPAALTITVDHINETTPAHGMCVQGNATVMAWAMIGGN